MVAYSFAAQFAFEVASGVKRQTVRGLRKRHARPGEPMQLYTAMRTKHCRKLLDVDPICVDVCPMVIAFDSSGRALFVRDGRLLWPEEAKAFAVADGFGAGEDPTTAVGRMRAFWMKHHGPEIFTGVVLTWTSAA